MARLSFGKPSNAEPNMMSAEAALRTMHPYMMRLTVRFCSGALLIIRYTSNAANSPMRRMWNMS